MKIEDKIAFLHSRIPHTITHALGIKFTRLEADFVEAEMPVNDATRQPFGILHGGASVVLAESLASMGAWLNIDADKYDVVGIEINANHLRSVRDGRVIGIGRPVHIGARTQVWEMRIDSDKGKPVCISRCTLAVIAKERA